MNKIVRRTGSPLLAIGLLLLAVTATAAEPRRGTDFDHFRTGFPLIGAHARVECETCHARGVFKGTPTQCALCHSPGSRIATSAKPANHVPTTLPCEQCHGSTVVSWTGARFPHTGVAPGSCASCHNGSMATGKHPQHIQTTQSCDTCHRTTAWIPAGFNHMGVVPGSCATCHNGTTATGKHATHTQTTASCDTCHRTTAWIPAAFNHANVTPGSCATCHNGTTARGKSPTHIPTVATCDQCHRTTTWQPSLGVTAVHTGVAPRSCAICHNGSYVASRAVGKPTNHLPTAESCDLCHRTTAWRPAGFDHTGVAPGSCMTCHNGTTATGKSPGHFVTTRSCDVCHTVPLSTTPTGRWPVRYTHTSPYYAAHSSSVNNNCASCHGSPSAETISTLTRYSPPPTCYGCHTHRNAYESGPHRKTQTPETRYTAVELHNCSGACHTYTDGTLTTISNSRPGPRHTPTNGRGMD